MGRPSEINTKTVSVRVPMEKYIELLQEAVSKNLSLSEYVTLRLFGVNDMKSKVNQRESKKKWVLKDTFSNKEHFEHSAFSRNEIVVKLTKSNDVISKNGKWKLKAIKKGLNHLYKLEE